MTDNRSNDVAVLAELAAIIASRQNASADTSYTAKLLSAGVEKCAKKFGEEAVELALASMTGDRDHVRSEAADVLYHLLVLLEKSGVPLNEVMKDLAGRFAMSGLEEKASRKVE